MSIFKKNILIPICSIVVVVSFVIFWGYYYLDRKTEQFATKSSDSTGSDVPVMKEKELIGKVAGIEDRETIENLFPLTMTEEDIQNAIHKMSHQKVVAPQKWGGLELTTERVDRLLEVVIKNEKKLKYVSTYKEILQKWSNKDFTKANKDHNEIWKLQGGSIGYATGVASNVEEEKFIKENFR